MPKLSVLLPVYNGAAHVRDAVASVLDQTFTDFELLVLDDASPDDSAAIAESFGDTRVRVVRNEENLGQVATLNRGLREARGEYVARLDQDDVCLPARFERQIELLDAAPSVAVVGTWMDVVDDDGRVVDALRTTIDGLADAVFLTLVNRLPIAHPSVMVRTRPVLDAGGYDEAVRYCEDMDLWRRLLLAGRGIRVVPEPLLRYRVHEGQQSLRHWDEQQANNAASLERFIAALAPAADARLLRIAFTKELDLWDELETSADGRRLVAELARLREGAAARLGMTSDEEAALDRLVRTHVARVALAGWRRGVGRYRRASPALARFGAGDGRPPLRYSAVYVAAPALTAARALYRRRP